MSWRRGEGDHPEQGKLALDCFSSTSCQPPETDIPGKADTEQSYILPKAGVIVVVARPSAAQIRAEILSVSHPAAATLGAEAQSLWGVTDPCSAVLRSRSTQWSPQYLN